MATVKRAIMKHKAASFAKILKNNQTDGIETGTFQTVNLVSSDISITSESATLYATESPIKITRITNISGTQVYADFTKEQESELFGYSIDDVSGIQSITESSQSNPVQYRVVNTMTDGTLQGITFQSVILQKESLMNTNADTSSVEIPEISINFEGDKNMKTGVFVTIEDVLEKDINTFLGLV